LVIRPTSTRITAPANAGQTTQPKPKSCRAGTMAKSRAVAPPGGCTVFVLSCATMVVDTAKAAQSHIHSPRPMAFRMV